jgi:hypothetical protein
MTDRPLLVFGVIGAALVGLLAVEYHAASLEDATLPQATARAAAEHAASRIAPAPAGGAGELQARVAAILARPLFQPTRRPPAVPATEAAGPSALPRLAGVLVSRAGRSVIFEGGADGKPVVVGEGGRIGAYVVTSIGDGEAVVTGPGGARTLHPAFGPPGATQPAAAPVSAGQANLLDLLRRDSAGPSVGIPGLPPISGSRK